MTEGTAEGTTTGGAGGSGGAAIPPRAAPAAINAGAARVAPGTGPSRLTDGGNTAQHVPGQRVRKRRRRKSTKPRKRGIWTFVFTLIFLIVLCGVWLALRGIGAAHSIRNARSSVLQAESDYRKGEVVPGQLAASVASEQADRAHRLSSDPIWHLAEHLPWVGSSFQTTSGLADAAVGLAKNVLPQAGSAAVAIEGENLRTPAGGVNLTALQSAITDLSGVPAAIAHAQAIIAGLPRHTAIGSIGSSRDSLASTLTDVNTQVNQILTGARLANTMLGADGPRTYFFALQNPAEIRGTGGLVGAYAIVQADHGVIKLLSNGSDEDLKNLPANKPPFDLGADYDAQWGGFEPTTTWQQSNFSPNFPDSATIWLSLWQKQTGTTLDGAIAITPEVAGDMLTATGKTVTLPDGTVLAGNQVANYTESTLYARYATNNKARKDALVALTNDIFDQFKAGANAKSVLQALARDAGKGGVLVASSHDDEETQLANTVVAGELPSTAGPFAHVIVNNTGGNKVDYYLTRQTTYDVGDSCSGVTRPTTITVTLHNGAPASGLTFYEAGDIDGVKGADRLYVTVYGAVGSSLVNATLDGKPAGMLTFQENGRPSYGGYVTIPPGGTSTLTLHLTEPTTGALVTHSEQPLHHPSDIQVKGRICS